MTAPAAAAPLEEEETYHLVVSRSLLDRFTEMGRRRNVFCPACREHHEAPDRGPRP